MLRTILLNFGTFEFHHLCLSGIAVIKFIGNLENNATAVITFRVNCFNINRSIPRINVIVIIPRLLLLLQITIIFIACAIDKVIITIVSIFKDISKK